MKCPLITMSAVTGKPSRQQIYEYMQSLKDADITQIMLYPRSGCEIEYLSEEWFNTVGIFIDAALELDMYIWLYDDFNWPSGDAGGRVTAISDYRLSAIIIKGDDAGNITVKSTHNSGLFGEKYFPNLLSYEAVDYFIKCTHEEYYKRFGVHFGTVIKGMFTDEPSIGYCCHGDCLPYYDGLKEDYFNAYGCELDSDIECQSAKLYEKAMAIISSRFKSCYLDKIASWCKNHGILMTGHFMCDHNPFYGVTHSGNVINNLSTLSLPGIDEICTNFEDECEMALLGTAEHARGENGAMAELFALGPCDMPYAKKRAMIYLCACHKIDHYFLAISHLDMRGNLLVKDYFNNFSLAQPDFMGMRELAKVATHAAAIAKKDFSPDLYIRFPFDLAYNNIGKSFDTMPFLSLINDLTYNQIQWKFTENQKEDAPVIEFNDRLEPNIDGKPFDISLFKHSLIVTDKEGYAPRGVFVRRFDDGTFVAINLFSNDGEYLINDKVVFLKKHDVYFSESNDVPKIREELFPNFNVSYQNPNIARTMHVNGESICEIHCDCDTEVVFALRNGVMATLNGEKILCQLPATELPKGMSEFYQTGEPCILKKGVNQIKSDNDFKYMPSLLLVGDFSYTITSDKVCRLTLYPRTHVCSCGEYINDYGKVELTEKIHIPMNAIQIELSGTPLFTKLYINDTLLGERAFSPYIFDIPTDMQGKDLDLKIVQYSSIAPIFGDIAHWDKTVTNCGWRGTPSPCQAPFGISKIRLLFNMLPLEFSPNL